MAPWRSPLHREWSSPRYYLQSSRLSLPHDNWYEDFPFSSIIYFTIVWLCVFPCSYDDRNYGRKISFRPRTCTRRHTFPLFRGKHGHRLPWKALGRRWTWCFTFVAIAHFNPNFWQPVIIIMERSGFTAVPTVEKWRPTFSLASSIINDSDTWCPINSRYHALHWQSWCSIFANLCFFF